MLQGFFKQLSELLMLNIVGIFIILKFQPAYAVTKFAQNKKTCLYILMSKIESV